MISPAPREPGRTREAGALSRVSDDRSGPVVAPPREADFSRRLAASVLVACMAAIAGLALWPVPVEIPMTEDAQHMLAFGVLTLLAWRIWQRAPGRIAAGMFALGTGIEALQWAFTPRHAEWRDLAADAAGIVIGIAISQAAAKWAAPRR
jgi:hypothetical protein